MRSTFLTFFAVAAACTTAALGSGCRDSSETGVTTSSATAGDGGSDGRGGAGGDESAGTGGGNTASSGAAGTTTTGVSSANSTNASSGTASSSSTGGGGAGGGFASCGIGMPPGGGAGGGAPGGRVRVVAANLSSGDDQGYDGGHGIRILQGLDADVVLMQEMNFGSNSGSAIDDLVDDVCSECNYIRGPQEQIPNGVLSRLPILACGSWVDPEVGNRNFVWARIDVPGAADLWAISVHFLTESASVRNREANALLDHIAGAIPATDMIVLGGDLNTNSRTESALSTLGALFETAGPHPADQDGNGDTNGPRDKPYDWVLADGDLFERQTTVEIGTSIFQDGAVIDTREYAPLSEISPALPNDSGASGMQHMAVVKDFAITE